MINLFRKKPVIIEAVQWTGKNVLEIHSFIHGAPSILNNPAREKWDDYSKDQEDKPWHVKTLEDGANGEAIHVAEINDWIIKGVKGEFYPCKPDIFEMTYEVING
jgi:hypothetical protein